MHRKPTIPKLLIPILAVALTATACGSADDGGDDPADSGDDGEVLNPGGADNASGSADGGDDGEVLDLGIGDVELASHLIRFNGCDAVLEYVRTEYASRVNPWGFDGYGGWWGGGRPVPMLEDMEDGAVTDEAATADRATKQLSGPADSKATATPGQELVEGVDYSGTNVQEAGVDEADIVKTDGERIFALSDGRLVVTDVTDRSVVSSVEVAGGRYSELFISGDSLLLIKPARHYGDGPETVLQRISLGGGTPEIVETLRVEGDYVSARSVGGTARVILRHNPEQRFPFVYPQSEAGEQTAEKANRAAVLDSTLDDWLPRYVSDNTGSANGQPLTDGDGQQLIGCENVHAPSVFSGFGVAVVMSVPIGGDFNPAAGSSAIMAPGDTVYASAESLYLATTVWQDAEHDQAETDETDDQAETDETDEISQSSTSSDDIAVLPDLPERDRRTSTSIHRFDITDPAGAVYQASGRCAGGHPQPVLALRARRPSARGHHHWRRMVGRRPDLKEPGARPAPERQPPDRGGQRRRHRQGRTGAVSALRRRHRLRGHLPEDRPVLHH